MYTCTDMENKNSNAKHFVGHNFVMNFHMHGYLHLSKWLYFTSVWIICMPLMPVVIRDIEKYLPLASSHLYACTSTKAKKELLITKLFEPQCC